MKTELTAFQYLIQVIKWRFTKNKYLGRKFYFMGKKRTVKKETCFHVIFPGVKYAIPKTYINTISRQKSQLSQKSNPANHAN